MPPARWRIAVSEQTHSSVANTMRIIDVDPLVVPAGRRPPHRRRAAAALDADGDPGSVCAVVATAGTTNAGLVDDLAGVARGVPRARHLDARRRGVRRRRAARAERARPRSPASSTPTRSSIDPHKWLYAPFDCAALLYRDPAFARSVHTQDASYLDVIHDDGRRVEPVRLRVPPHPPRARAAAVVLARGQRLRRVPRRDRARARDGARRGRAHPRAAPTSSWCASPSSRWCCSAARGWTRRRLRRVVGAAARGADRVRRAVALARRARRRASRSCIPRPRSTSSTRSSPPTALTRRLAVSTRPRARAARRGAASSSREHRARVRAVGRDHEEPRVAASQQLVVEAMTVDDARTRAAGRTCRAARRRARACTCRPTSVRLRERARGVTEALHGLARIDDLGRVDAEQADLLDATVARARDHRVAVDVADHRCGDARRDATARVPTPPDAPEQGGHDHREHRQATSHGPGAGHARNVAATRTKIGAGPQLG